MRIEQDDIGSLNIPAEALYGIHSVRAKNNFPYHDPMHLEWYKAIGITKLSVYKSYAQYQQAIQSKDKKIPNTLKFLSAKHLAALSEAAAEMTEGKHFAHFIVPATQGGAGTSMHMNCNEIIANVALKKIDKEPGQYQYIDPIESANVFQSTNDVIPTALAIACLRLLEQLEASINLLREGFESLEKNYRNVLRPAYTQMQQSIPSSYGRLFSTYNDALSRDWWRVSKCKERLKTVNLGGSAIGTSLNVPRYLVMHAVQHLQQLTQLPLARAENLADATSNMDRFVEVHAILKAHAVNLEKISADLRLLSSDIMQSGQLSIPHKQTGSSIMPGKKNPVIPEYLISIAHKVYANDQLVSSLAGQGCLELNAYLPTMGHALLQSIDMLTYANESLYNNLLRDMQVEEKASYDAAIKSPSITTALIPHIGYHKAGEIAALMRKNALTIFEANEKANYIDKQKMREILSPDKLLKGGYTLDDIT